MTVLHSDSKKLNEFYDASNFLQSVLFEYFVVTYKQLFAKNPVQGVSPDDLTMIVNAKSSTLAYYLTADPPDIENMKIYPEVKAMMQEEWNEEVQEFADFCLGDGSYMANEIRRIVLPVLGIKYKTLDEMTDETSYKKEAFKICENVISKFNGKDIPNYNLRQCTDQILIFTKKLTVALNDK